MTEQMLESPPSPEITRSMVRLSTNQYHQMIEQGIIPEDASTELLDGVIVYKDRGDATENTMGHGALHRLAVRLLTKLAAKIDSDLRHLQIQLPVQVSDFDAPEPDGAIILGSDRDFANHLPAAEEVSCVLEVAHSSLERDAMEKLEKFAGAGIPQYVIINLRENQIELYVQPNNTTRTYATKTIALKGQTLRLFLGMGEFLEIAVADILP